METFSRKFGQVSRWTKSRMTKKEGRKDFWSIEGNHIHRHHVELRVQLYVRKEGTFPNPLRYIDVTRTTHTPHKSIWDLPEAIEGVPFVPYERYVAPLSLSAIEANWSLISPLLTTDDVVRWRTIARLWKELWIFSSNSLKTIPS